MTVTIDPPSVPADGTSVATITVRFRNPETEQPWKGQQVALTSSGKGNRIVIPNSVTNDDGVVTGTISSTLVESKTISAQVGSFYNTKNVNFTGCKSALFVPLDTLPSGELPYSPVAADFNRDGNVDIAYVRDRVNLVVLLGNGAGGFQGLTAYNPGAVLGSVQAGDLNGDGKPDIVVTTAKEGGGNVVAVLAGRGDGKFDRQIDYPIVDLSAVLPFVDLNGDRKPDVAIVSFSGNSVTVLLGNGDGTLQSGVNVPVAQKPTGALYGDFNGDGKLDLSVVTESDKRLNVLLGNGDGSFRNVFAYPVTDNPGHRSSVGDLNGDGKLDLAIADLDGAGNVFLGNGDGSFKRGADYRVGVDPYLNSADVDGDGKLDLLAAASNEEGDLSLLPGKGDGTFEAAIKYRLPFPNGPLVADFNSDGKQDVAVMSLDSLNVFAKTGCTR